MRLPVFDRLTAVRLQVADLKEPSPKDFEQDTRVAAVEQEAATLRADLAALVARVVALEGGRQP